MSDMVRQRILDGTLTEYIEELLARAEQAEAEVAELRERVANLCARPGGCVQ